MQHKITMPGPMRMWGWIKMLAWPKMRATATTTRAFADAEKPQDKPNRVASMEAVPKRTAGREPGGPTKHVHASAAATTKAATTHAPTDAVKRPGKPTRPASTAAGRKKTAEHEQDEPTTNVCATTAATTQATTNAPTGATKPREPSINAASTAAVQQKTAEPRLHATTANACVSDAVTTKAETTNAPTGATKPHAPSTSAAWTAADQQKTAGQNLHATKRNASASVAATIKAETMNAPTGATKPAEPLCNAVAKVEGRQKNAEPKQSAPTTNACVNAVAKGATKNAPMSA